MATASATAAEPRKLKGDPELKRKLKELCVTDNVTNWYYLARAYAVIGVSIGGTVWFYYYALSAGISLWWVLPAAIASIVAVGASQHQLAGATHEATHHTLFKNRWLNELISDWLCMFPVFSTTYSFRLYHLVHHQFINDPERDPDFVVLAKSGHWMNFPVRAAEYIGMLCKQLLIVPLVKYILVRFYYNALGVEGAKAYQRKEKGSKLPFVLGAAWLAGMVALAVTLYRNGNPTLLAVALPAYWLIILSVLAVLPDRLFEMARSARSTTHAGWRPAGCSS